jgi:thiol-disulfide isomerase/thioredoxin
MFRDLIRFFSYRSFLVAAGGVGLVLAVGLGFDGVTLLDGLLMAAYLGLCGALMLWLRTPRDKALPFNAQTAFDQAIHSGTPTLLEFYSDLCAACMANRPFLDEFENANGPRLQILRVNVNDPGIGRALADRYGVTFTPTFILLDEDGRKQQEFLYAFNRTRVLYWLHQRARA